jgi:hypothetical protein
MKSSFSKEILIRWTLVIVFSISTLLLPPVVATTSSRAELVNSENSAVFEKIATLKNPQAVVDSPDGSFADLEKEKNELLRLHRSDREAHFKGDVDLLQRSALEEMISVRDGKITKIKKEDQRKRFSDYFRGATYYEWDDMEDPIIHISRDGSMAWMITRLKVRRTQKDAGGIDREEKFVYAGIMTYEKVDGKWMRVANVSTFEPEDKS